MFRSNPKSSKNFNWRGFTLQLFLVTIFPITVLLLLVVFGSQSLHHQAMRNLVGDRDLRTVRAAAGSVGQKVLRLTNMIELLSRDLNNNRDFSSFLWTQEEISLIFDGGLVLYTKDGSLIRSFDTVFDWDSSSADLMMLVESLRNSDEKFLFSDYLLMGQDSGQYLLVGTLTENQDILIGAFSPSQLIETAIGNGLNSGLTTILVVAPGRETEMFEILYQTDSLKMQKDGLAHPSILNSLKGESGTNFYQTEEGEHVIAFAPIPATSWGLISEEAWEDISNPYLNTTQYASLMLVPVFLLALLVIWFGARRIIGPLQKLEKQAASLAEGNFEAIQQPVGGIEEIQTVQAELMEMAIKLKAAQQNLRSYIGAMTDGIENERRSLAREIHDDTIQSLIALNQRIQILMMNASEEQRDDLEALLELMKQTMENLRRMIRGLRPIYLEDLGLATSLDMLVREMEQSAQIPIKFMVVGEERRFTPQIEMSFYRMAQESLNNVLHHADAKQSSVTLTFTESELTLRVQDDGKGFIVPNNSAEFPKQGHFGLLGLQERAELINAELSITSKPGGGTIIFIRLPASESFSIG